MIASKNVSPGHRPTLSIDLLIHDGRMLDHVATCGVHYQVSRSVERDGSSAVEGQPDRAGIGTGSDHEIVFELLLIAVVDQVDAPIDTLVIDFGVVGDVGMPL